MAVIAHPGDNLLIQAMERGLTIIRMAAIAAFVLLSSAQFMTGPAAAEPQGFVIEAVMATPEADTPIDHDTRIDVEGEGYILIIMRDGQIFRQDGPFHEVAASLLDKIVEPGGDDVGNGILSSLLELAEVSGKSMEQLGGVRGAERQNDAHAKAITAVTKTYCFVAGEAPGFYASQPPKRDEPLILRLRASPKSFYQATWPVGVTDLPWPADWPLPEEGRYIWSIGSQGPAPLWFRAVDDLPDSLTLRAALYNDMRCYTQAIALMRQILESAKPL